ncbi:ArsR/SmtB family transcription factor [Levilactobacillus tujiorum]|uniref:Winged helix-turn-helix transcriptional regulator n=1 Tax=Levilactobacillus tujiorum TaxID=2912243 RepID=A0ABX1L0X1_9LACO|nr:metalloregulator ArsR/SmtB family transcription factor [Levilactobacillus tujiorum]MCH5463678.1 metalloregulator ArsR/SmtB family transcription factor [Levilactobacillus tujiorum]NLR10883.1 winged helix-turn-helix transcriptional regulator [Lactobacillus sp. HBUAS51387]NLR28665.1 winged helix-turn-helix transcriptional regulator [Levilactobacillus tujiorum]
MTKQLSKNEQAILIFKALADPVRLEILHYLKQCDHEVSCGEVGQAIGISKTSGSYHFKLLQTAGLITARKESREKYVALDQSTFEQVVGHFWDNL